MKYSNNIKAHIPKLLIIFTLVIQSPYLSAQDGQALFNANCASCHKPDADFVGPALKGAKGRWEKNSSIENFYAWVKNSQDVIRSGDAYAVKLFNDWGKSVMTAQALTNEEIDAIFEYVESAEVAAAGPSGDSIEGEDITQDNSESSSSIWWYMIALSLLLIVLMSLASVKKQLTNAVRESKGEEPLPEFSSESVKGWFWKNKGIIGFLGFVGFVALGVQLLIVLTGIGVQDGYKPSQPIAFSHAVHAGQNEISCVYCHNSVEKSKSAGIPTVNVCMNCHKAVAKGTTTGETEISKIYKAAGWNANEFSYTGKTSPIKWIKVHNLPDHVYFNHSQHVKVGGIECQQCHGDMTKQDLAKVMTVEELNKVEGNIQLTRRTLTMGWCIECHQEKDIDLSSSGYYEEIHKRLLNDKALYKKYLEDEKISVSELGGWECAKCHY